MSFNFLTKGLAVAAATGSKFLSMINPPVCKETVKSYNDEISWVQGNIEEELALTDKLLSKLWQAENDLNEGLAKIKKDQQTKCQENADEAAKAKREAADAAAKAIKDAAD